MSTKLTALDMVTRVRRGLGNPPTDEIETSVLLESVNLAYRKVCAKFNHAELDASMSLTCTASDSTLDLTVPISNIKRLGCPVNTTISTPMMYIESDQMDDLNRGLNSPGNPYRYTLTPGSTAGYMALELWPVPSGTDAITVPYEKMPDDLVLSPSETSTILAPQWDEPIVLAAIADVAAILGDFQRAQYYENKFQNTCKEVFPGSFKASEMPNRILPLRP